VILLLISVGIVLLAAYATARLLLDELSTPMQKCAQIAVAWLLPVVGPLAMLSLVDPPPLRREKGSVRSSTGGADIHGYGD
jgi:hypothetical protein